MRAEVPLLDPLVQYGRVATQKARHLFAEGMRSGGPKSSIKVVGYPIGLVAVTTIWLMFFTTKFPVGHVSSVYLIPVLICATQWGLLPALIASVRSTTGEPIIKAGPLIIDLASRRVYLEHERISVTRKEYRLLQVLGQHAGNVVTHQHLLKQLWGTSQVHLTQYLRI